MRPRTYREARMYAVDDAIDVCCPQCANGESVYVEKIERVLKAPVETYLCRCGKCGWRFKVPAEPSAADAAKLLGPVP